MPLTDKIIAYSTDAELEPLITAAARSRYVLIGEASHGTHEFYATRAYITKELISKHGFSAVCIEGDWPDAYRVHRYVSAQGQVVQARNTVELRRQQLLNTIGGIQAPRVAPQPPGE